jgi:hypothetical protein
MTKATFKRWLKQYAVAHMELILVGSHPTVEEQQEAREYWLKEKKLAEDKLLEAYAKRS